jgi:aryl-alcohol dehydrogenase-like predicted oxidoreductase
VNFAIGTAQFGTKYGVLNSRGLTPTSEVSKILEIAAQSGIDTIDTAIGYGDAEKVLGNLGVKNFRLVSKIPSIPIETEDIEHWMLSVVMSSITKLNVKALYGLLLHKPSQLLDNQGLEIYKALKNIQKLGLVKKIGISIYDPSEYFCLQNKYKFDLVQLPLNVVDRRALDTDLLFNLQAQGIEVHVRSIFLQGLLLAEINEIPRKFHKWLKFFEEWERWTRDKNITKLEACLGFINSYPSINRVIVGIENANSLGEILKSCNKSLINFPINTVPDIDDLINPFKWSKL